MIIDQARRITCPGKALLVKIKVGQEYFTSGRQIYDNASL